MLTKKRSLYGVLISFCLVPVILLFLPYLISFAVPERWGQFADDLAIVVIALLLNHYLWHIDIHFFNRHHSWYQLLQCLPALLFLVFTRIGSWGAMDKGMLTIRVLLTVLFVALAEELVFRGLLIPLSLTLTNNRRFLAVVISSVGFAVAHLVNLVHMAPSVVGLQLLLVFSTGMLWGAVYLTTHNLLLTIVLHFFDDLPLFATKAAGGFGSFSSHEMLMISIIYLGIAAVFSLIAYLQLRLARGRDGQLKIDQ
ncbi:CPBP family intramembrane glutamic endopeptidase [Lactiplantibacillus herbarum]|uniref:CPBP family intramembrane glutamic endopeptidase n=1 Tax=Lactiplantibacillus herbarum TaxID=1670446 RepID=UPI00064F6DD9|nr:CPBP family intramembrane glutamic endopeptidase [Lactiplantibacillus herbarum]